MKLSRIWKSGGLALIAALGLSTAPVQAQQPSEVKVGLLVPRGIG